jgi:hypothetical protein
MLSDGRPYVLGDTIALADCVIYHALWIVDQLAHERVVLIPPTARRWMDRIAAHGHGAFTPMTALEALDVAAAATPLPPLPSEVLEGDPALGTEVSLTPTDSGAPILVLAPLPISTRPAWACCTATIASAKSPSTSRASPIASTHSAADKTRRASTLLVLHHNNHQRQSGARLPAPFSYSGQV